MNPRKIAISELLASGFTKIREGANHEIYFLPGTNTMIPIRRHFTDHDLLIIRQEIKRAKRQAGE